MISLSLCMIVRDEEEVIGRCLDSVKDIVDEIVIIDTGSIDRTKEIVGCYTSKIYDFEWVDDFSAARNYSFSKATQDYILWLDADDVILEEDRIKFKVLKQSLDPSTDVVMMKYNIDFDKSGITTLTFYRERLLKRSKNFQWQEHVHEYIKFDGTIISSDISITHKKIHKRLGRNLSILEKLASSGEELSPRSCFYYARELVFNEKYEDAINYYTKFLNIENQPTSNYLDSCFDLAKCYMSIGDMKNALRALLKSFEYSPPRAEICCEIGYYYKKIEDYKTAMIWFSLALTFNKPVDILGYVINEYWDFIPCIELSICCFKLGNIIEAIKYNEKAADYKPTHPVVLQNREYFKSIF